MRITSWFKALINDYKAAGLPHRCELDEKGELIYELFSVASYQNHLHFWRIIPILVIEREQTGVVQQLSPRFLEYLELWFVPRLYVLSDTAVSKHLHELQDQGLTIIEMFDEHGLETLSEILKTVIYKPQVSNEQIKKCSASYQGKSLSDSVEHRLFLQNAIFVAFNMLSNEQLLIDMLTHKPKEDNFKHNTISHASSYTIKRNQINNEVHKFIYPNKFWIKSQIYTSQQMISFLGDVKIDPELEIIRKCLLETYESMLSLHLNILYGVDIVNCINQIIASFSKLLQDEIIVYMLEIFDKLDFNLKMLLINNLIKMKASVPSVERLFGELLDSSIRPLVLKSISGIPVLGFTSLQPKLKALSRDRSNRVREAARDALVALSNSERLEKLNNSNFPSQLLEIPETGEEIINAGAVERIYRGPKNTSISISLIDLDQDECIAVTNHYSTGTRDMLTGCKTGMYSEICGRLLGLIAPLKDKNLAGMGEMIIYGGKTGEIEKIDLGKKEESDENG